MKKIRQDFIAGARDTLPILLGVVPFATICGVAAVNVGLTPFEAIGMNVIVFAGASQLAVFQLMSIGSPWIIMVLTAWVINVRFTMYSAALAPYLQKEPLPRKSFFTYMLSDQAFGVTMGRFSNQMPSNPAWYYYGSAAIIWVTWIICAVAGALLGTLVPESWGFDFAFPLSFMALMFAALKDRPTVVAALVGGTTAVLAKGLPYNLGLILAALLGIASGMLVESLRQPAREGALQ
ncbi:MAG: AzlC family ABC transporter permease [Anaerolineales bacterium]|jgi:predicted branched-subunit amino acid permease